MQVWTIVSGNGITNVRDMMDCPETEDSLIACAADKRRWSAQSEQGQMAAPRFVEVASYTWKTQQSRLMRFQPAPETITAAALTH